jgi:hypothetical protein
MKHALLWSALAIALGPAPAHALEDLNVVLELHDVAPQPGTELSEGSTVVAHLQYRIKGFTPGDFALIPQVETNEASTTSGGWKPSDDVALDAAQGQATVSFPIQRVWNDAMVKRPFRIWFYLTRRAGPDRSIVVGRAGPIEYGTRSAPLAGEPASFSKTEDIRRMLALTGSAELGKQVLDNLMAMQKRLRPQVPDEVWAEIRNGFDDEEMLATVSTIYDRHLSHEDIRGLIAFYESPLGTRLRGELPAILQESMTAGEAWGAKVGERMLEKLRQKGYGAIADMAPGVPSAGR